MLTSMIDIPQLQQSILLIALENENLERMKKADPATLESVNMGGILPPPKYPNNFSVMIAHEEDSELLCQMAASPNTIDFLRWLERGRTWIEGKDGKVTEIQKAGQA